MHSLTLPSGAPQGARVVHMIWLPGAFQQAADFVSAGFHRAVAQRHMPLELTFVDLEMAHLQDREPLRQLHKDIILPLCQRNADVWLGGISLGALFALDYAEKHGDALSGICLLAPYLGNRQLIGEIRAAPGLAAWTPGKLAEDDEERRIWRYLKGRGAGDPPLYVGVARGDRFASSQQLLADTLPPDAIMETDGDHDWRSYSALWEIFLDSNRL
jgi:pimeloyl-ACP methyl ester carboxylesterase